MQFFTRRVRTALTAGRSLRLLGALVAATLLGALLARGVSAALATETPTTYYPCVNLAGGHIAMTTARGTYAPPETKISWNQLGPVGPTGPQGPSGPSGPQGPPGATRGY
jgi:hypothetical protein